MGGLSPPPHASSYVCSHGYLFRHARVPLIGVFGYSPLLPISAAEAASPREKLCCQSRHWGETFRLASPVSRETNAPGGAMPRKRSYGLRQVSLCRVYRHVGSGDSHLSGSQLLGSAIRQSGVAESAVDGEPSPILGRWARRAARGRARARQDRTEIGRPFSDERGDLAR